MAVVSATSEPTEAHTDFLYSLPSRLNISVTPGEEIQYVAGSALIKMLIIRCYQSSLYRPQDRLPSSRSMCNLACTWMRAYLCSRHDSGLVWEDIAWVKSLAPDTPLVIKGIGAWEVSELVPSNELILSSRTLHWHSNTVLTPSSYQITVVELWITLMLHFAPFEISMFTLPS